MKQGMKFGGLLVAVAAVTGCGGGGSGGGSAPPVVTLPTPAPTPAPTPTPAPAPTYALATDFTTDKDYTGWGMQFVSVSRPAPAGSPAGTPPTRTFVANIANETRAAGFTYSASARTYDVRWFAEMQRYGPVTSSLFQGIPLDSAGDFGRSHFRWSPTIANHLQYSGLVGWTQSVGSQVDGEVRDYRSIYGVTTVPSDLPTTGTFRYDMPTIVFRGGIDRPRVVGSEIVSVTIDWATGRMTGRLTEVLPPNTPASVTPIDIAVDGIVNLNTSRVTGTLAGNGFNGNITGALFGPRGRELGFVFRLSDGTGGVMGGAAGGHNLSGG